MVCNIKMTDQIVLNAFKALTVTDEDGKAHVVPVTWGTVEQTLSLFQDNVRGDKGLVVDRIHLPAVSIVRTGIRPSPTVNFHYTVTAWNVFQDSADQIAEQVLTKFSDPVYADQGDGWLTLVVLTSIANDQDDEPRKKVRVQKDSYLITAIPNAKQKSERV